MLNMYKEDLMSEMAWSQRYNKVENRAEKAKNWDRELEEA